MVGAAPARADDRAPIRSADRGRPGRRPHGLRGAHAGHSAEQVVAKSTDFGQTWTSKIVEPFSRSTDKDLLAVRGRDVYLGYHRGDRVYVSRLARRRRNVVGRERARPKTQRHVGQSLASGAAVDTHGKVYFAWNGVRHGFRSLGPVYLFCHEHSDGGATWTSKQIAKAQGGPRCGCDGWDYWGPAIALQQTTPTTSTSSGIRTTSTSRLRSSTRRLDRWRPNGTRKPGPSRAPRGTNHLFPALVAQGNGDVRCRVGWTIATASNTAATTRTRAGTRTRASQATAASRGGPRHFVALRPGVPVQAADPKDGFLEPYGDYFELAIDGSGRTHALWGEGPSYQDPGTSGTRARVRPARRTASRSSSTAYGSRA